MKPIGKDIFQAVEALQRVEFLLQTSFKQESELEVLFTQELLPRAVMNGVAIMPVSSTHLFRRCPSLPDHSRSSPSR